MSSNYCEDCGCRVYNGHCVNCHEETYIAEQNESMTDSDDMIVFSPEFVEKVEQQKEEAKVILENQNERKTKTTTGEDEAGPDQR